jgi:hypothetical protein
MQFLQYLNEGRKVVAKDNDISTMQRLIIQDCQPYLSLRGNKVKSKPLFRANIWRVIMDGMMGYKDVRQDRQPKGMNPKDFKIFNDLLIKAGHTDRSQSISVVGKSLGISIHGQVYAIVPTGKFNYSFAPTRDLHFEARDWEPDVLHQLEYMDKEDEIHLTKQINKITTNKDLDKAMTKGYEIWMNPTGYYMMREDTYDLVMKDM